MWRPLYWTMAFIGGDQGSKEYHNIRVCHATNVAPSFRQLQSPPVTPLHPRTFHIVHFSYCTAFASIWLIVLLSPLSIPIFTTWSPICFRIFHIRWLSTNYVCTLLDYDCEPWANESRTGQAINSVAWPSSARQRSSLGGLRLLSWAAATLLLKVGIYIIWCSWESIGCISSDSHF